MRYNFVVDDSRTSAGAFTIVNNLAILWLGVEGEGRGRRRHSQFSLGVLRRIVLQKMRIPGPLRSRSIREGLQMRVPGLKKGGRCGSIHTFWCLFVMNLVTVWILSWLSGTGCQFPTGSLLKRHSTGRLCVAAG